MNEIVIAITKFICALTIGGTILWVLMQLLKKYYVRD